MMPFGQVSPDEMINETDEALFDEVEQKVTSIKRNVLQTSLLAPIPPVKDILDSLKCSICMETVIKPQVIKHCLHFFCKECIERAVKNFKKHECPLCKEQMKTHRELRAYTKMESIVNLIRPLIERE